MASCHLSCFHDDVRVVVTAFKRPHIIELEIVCLVPCTWRYAYQQGAFAVSIGCLHTHSVYDSLGEVMLAELEKRDNAEGIEKVYYYLNDAQTYYLATVDDGKPRVRPFGTILLDDGKLYIQTGRVKDVSKQIAACPFVEICACMGTSWLRIQAELVEDDNREVKVKMLDKMPSLKAMYSPDDDNTQMFYLKDATATFSSFTAEPEVIQF